MKAAETYWNAIDEDAETFISAPTMEFELECPAVIKEMKFIPRTANNMIVAGNLYSLCYFQDGIWKEFERKKAKDGSLSFKNVPAGGCTFLRIWITGKRNYLFYMKEESKSGFHNNPPSLC